MRIKRLQLTVRGFVQGGRRGGGRSVLRAGSEASHRAAVGVWSPHGGRQLSREPLDRARSKRDEAMRTLIGLLALLCLNSPPTAADSGCGSFQASVGPPALELAPPAGFVEICSRDAALCAKLSSGYPPTAKTVGYFVTPQEWGRYREGRLSGFTRYLIAQISEGTAPSEFPDLKNFIRSRQGDIPDNTALPPVFDAAGRFSIGIFEDSDTAISSGVVMKLQPAASGATSELILASTNTAFLANGRVLSLYAFTDVTANPSAEPVKQLTREWLKCIRSAK